MRFAVAMFFFPLIYFHYRCLVLIDWAFCGIFNFSVCGTFCRSTGMMTPGPSSRLIHQPTVVNMSVNFNYWHEWLLISEDLQLAKVQTFVIKKTN